MTSSVLLALVVLCVSLSCVSSQSFCDKYSQALFNSTDGPTETKLVTAIVTRAVLGDETVRPPVPGLVNPRSPILQFFNGSVKYRHSGETPNYLTDKTALATLAAHFVSFLGDSLGCSGDGFNKTDYNKDQKYIHELMHIDQQQMDYFNEQFALTLLSFGVTVADVEGTVVPFLGLFQRGAGMMREICTAPNCWPVNMPVAPTTLTFCEKYSVALIGNATGRSEVDLLTAVITTTVFGTKDTQHGVMVDGLAAPTSPLLAILNGSVPYRQDGSQAPDYLTNTRELTRLAVKFVEFFGGALGCHSLGFPRYEPTGNHTQNYFHAKMGIDKEKMLYFDTQVANTLIYFGVPADGPDLKAAAAFLASFNKGAGDNEICTEADCPTVPGAYKHNSRRSKLVAAIKGMIAL